MGKTFHLSKSDDGVSNGGYVSQFDEITAAEAGDSKESGEGGASPPRESRHVPTTVAILTLFVMIVGISGSLIIYFNLQENAKPRQPERRADLLTCDPAGSGVTEEVCESWGCQFVEGWCYLPQGGQYSVVDITQGQNRVTLTMEAAADATTVLGQKLIQKINIDLYKYHADTIRLKVTDANNPTGRWEVPAEELLNLSYEPPSDGELTDDDQFMYRVNWTVTTDKKELMLSIARSDDDGATVIWNMSMGGLIMSDQYLQISTKLPSRNVFGFGENRHPRYRHDLNYHTWPMFATDQPPTSGIHHPLYGVHPFYMCVEDGGQAHGVFLLNSNAMEYEFQPTPALTLRTIGGVLDLFMFFGPSPENVVQQYTRLVGRSVMPPYWALGFQQSRWGHDDLQTLKQSVISTLSHQIPLDVVYLDIDHMAARKDFTYNIVEFDGLPEFIDELHSMGIRVVLILDPAIVVYDSSYDTCVNAKKLHGNDIYINWSAEDAVNRSTDIVLGKVWPDGAVGFPDFFKNSTQQWWLDEITNWHKTLDFDGLWIDMNEPANFDTNGEGDHDLRCAENKYDDPPYATRAASVYDDQDKGTTGRLSSRTLCMNAEHGHTKHYNTHNLYGLSEMPVTQRAARQSTGKRSLVISRSTYPGAGQYGYHWLGDNYARWEDLHHSVIGMLEFNIFGMPYVGADICGFFEDADLQMCLRWMQLGAFYPYARNHNNRDTRAQHPGSWDDDTFTSSVREVLLVRYRLLPYLYTLFYHSHVSGNTVVRPLLHEYPDDPNTYSVDTQFMWGAALMVSPVLTANTTEVLVYFPNDTWYDYFTAEELSEFGKHVLVNASLDSIPLHLRGGHILPVQEPAINTQLSRQNKMGLVVALRTDSVGISIAHGDLFWDDGDSQDTIENGEYYYAKYIYENNSLRSEVIHNGITDEMSTLLPQLDHMDILGLPAAVQEWLDLQLYTGAGSCGEANSKGETRVDGRSLTYTLVPGGDGNTQVLHISGLDINMADDFCIQLW